MKPGRVIPKPSRRDGWRKDASRRVCEPRGLQGAHVDPGHLFGNGLERVDGSVEEAKAHPRS
eukprot:scaffold1386_cov342-Pavlova_lutheri.AAC.7